MCALRQCVSGNVHCIDLTVILGGMFENKEVRVGKSAVIYFMCLFNDAVSNSEYIASVVTRINKQFFLGRI